MSVHCKTIFCKSGRSEKTLQGISGECLERIGIKLTNKSYCIYKKVNKVKVGDVVVCNRISGQVNLYAKQVKSIHDGVITVGTAYTDPTRDFEFDAEEILGEVIEVYDAILGNLIWKKQRKTSAE